MSDAVREMTREELVDRANKLRDEVEKYRVSFESAKMERDAQVSKERARVAEMKDEIDKMACVVSQVNAVLLEVFGIEYAAARSMEDLKEKLRTAVSEAKPDIPPEEPIDAAAWLINAKGKRTTNAIQRSFCGAGEYEYYDIYSVAGLRQIAEHLLVYCNCGAKN